MSLHSLDSFCCLLGDGKNIKLFEFYGNFFLYDFISKREEKKWRKSPKKKNYYYCDERTELKKTHIRGRRERQREVRVCTRAINVTGSQSWGQWPNNGPILIYSHSISLSIRLSLGFKFYLFFFLVLVFSFAASCVCEEINILILFVCLLSFFFRA